ncbi:hypothetical protein BI347_12890 [Chromobacterium sphagni]|uniref:NADPH-dependent FMN reductase-like domain-containing protein n=1 Tax=Chromobacterium sphagni TaxID=1903179 RepID=A0A1S1X4E1_9NEIS|nr:hypothetical protein BI347_12890 [Chromobacterium sphagni]
MSAAPPFDQALPFQRGQLPADCRVVASRVFGKLHHAHRPYRAEARNQGKERAVERNAGLPQLPMADEPGIPAQGVYSSEHALAWSEKIAGADGFVFVTPQYNWG